ncbi:MAG: alpha/beta hydrolase [Actinobacteria bacterium]|nr:alpha/beta hydrolase [Actinomycetota bacterium]
MLRGLPATRSGEIERDGAAVRFQVFGSGERAILLLPTWSIVHTDFWRKQVPHLAERYTVLTFDGLGNGASDRPTDPAYYADEEFVTDAVNVMNAAEIEQAAVMSASMGASWQLLLAYHFPERVGASVYIATDLPLAPLPPGYAEAEPRFDEQPTGHEGWMMWNRRFWHENWPAFCEFFFSRCFTEPDSDEEIAHFVSMGLETWPEVIAATIDAIGVSEEIAREAAAAIQVPTLVIHGDEDAISSVEAGRELARLSGGDLIILPGSGHEPQCRIPTQVNALLDVFLARHHPPA